MTKLPSLANLRQVFALLFPMQGVVVVGAGRGQGLEDFQPAASVLLVDARAECIEPLHKQCADLPNATAVQAVIGARTGTTAFHVASKPDESALITPESLQPLWRNLTISSVDEVEARTLAELLASLEPVPDFRCNWLVIDCLPALSVLEGAGRMIDDFDVLELRCVRDGALPREEGVSLESAEQWLEARGFRLAAQFEETLPQLCKAVFCRDVQRLGGKLGGLENELARQKRSSEDQQKQLSLVTAERDTLLNDKAALTVEHQQLTAARDTLANENAALTAERDDLAKEKQALIAERALFADLDIRFKQQIDEFTKLRKFTDTSVKKHLGATTRQLEATLSLQRYFATGELLDFALDRQLWPLSPDFSRYLVDLIELNDYDLIIEFGTGFTTPLIALLLARRANRRVGRPVAFVSFEHLEPQAQQARASLQRAGLADLAQIELAPLEDWQGPSALRQPYYACGAKLAELAKVNPPAGLRVLVLAQGPHAVEDAQARYPAGPSVFTHFAGAHIDFLLPGCTRDDEKQVIERWQAEMAGAGGDQALTERVL